MNHMPFFPCEKITYCMSAQIKVIVRIVRAQWWLMSSVSNHARWQFRVKDISLKTCWFSFLFNFKTYIFLCIPHCILLGGNKSEGKDTSDWNIDVNEGDGIIHCVYVRQFNYHSELSSKQYFMLAWWRYKCSLICAWPLYIDTPQLWTHITERAYDDRVSRYDSKVSFPTR